MFFIRRGLILTGADVVGMNGLRKQNNQPGRKKGDMFTADMFSYPDTKWDMCQIRIQPDLKERAMIELRKDGLNLSLFIRMTLTRYIKNKDGLYDPRILEPVGNAVKEVMDYLPAVLKNQHYKKGY